MLHQVEGLETNKSSRVLWIAASIAAGAAQAAPSDRAAFFGEVVESQSGRLAVRDAGATGVLHAVQLDVSTHFANGSANSIKVGDHLFVSGEPTSGLLLF